MSNATGRSNTINGNTLNSTGDTGKGAPALGGPGDRSNESISAARGSAHTSNRIPSDESQGGPGVRLTPTPASSPTKK